jgi:glycosyltransferase involved in cell wall biosynthesis
LEANSDDRDWLQSSLPGTSIHSFPGAGSNAFVFSPRLLLWLARHAREFDVIHVHGLLNPVSSLSASVALKRKVPLVLHPFGTMSRYTFGHRRTRLKKAYFRLLDGPHLRKAGAVHFTTATERDESRWRGIEWGSRAHIIPPPWIGDEAPLPPRDFDRPGNRVVIIARLNPVKNLEALLDAWSIVMTKMPDAHLTIAGDGDPDYVGGLQKHSMRNRISGNVKFAGFLTGGHKASLLQSADLFVLPSYHENFGVVVIEALSAGVPVLVTPEVQLSSFVAEHGLGRIVSRDPQTLADGIVAALNDKELRTRCHAICPGLVRANFAPEKIGLMLKSMYESAIAETRRRRR